MASHNADVLSSIKWRMPLHQLESIQRATSPSVGRSSGQAMEPFRHGPRWYRNGTDIVVMVAALAIVTFSMPYRSGGGIDAIGMLKFGLRLLAVVWFGAECLIVLSASFRSWSSQHICRLATSDRSRDEPWNLCSLFARWLLSGVWRPPILFPWICFAAWSTLTIIWSPLKVFSFGQWIGLLALLLLSQSIATRFRPGFHRKASRSASGVRDWRFMLFAMQIILSIYCVMIVAGYCISPEASGLQREVLYAGVAGLVHPTAAGATSALAILTGSLVWLLRLTRHRWIVVATMPANATLLLLSNSRTSMLMLAVSLLIAVVFLSTRAQKGIGLVTIGVLLLAAMTFSPGSQWLGHQSEKVSGYLMRGQSADDLKHVSGRSEMWSTIWEEYKHSALIGHGYYVTSRTGELYVWGRLDNHDAHNIFLQSLASGGIVGCTLLVWALARLIGSFCKSVVERLACLRTSTEISDDDFLWCVGLIGLWYVGWSQTCTTFLGPIRPESVVFYVLLGLFAARQNPAPTSGVLSP